MQLICNACSMCVCVLACFVAVTATPITRTEDPARNLRTERAVRIARNLLQLLPSSGAAPSNSPAATPFYAELPEVADDGSRISRMSSGIKNLLDVAFSARETFGKMCNTFCVTNGLSATCCQYITNHIKSTSEFMSDSEILEKSRTEIEQMTAIVEMAGKYTNEIRHMTAQVQSAPCLDPRGCPLSEDSCDRGNMDTQFCYLVYLNQRMTSFSKSCEHILKDMMPTTAPTTTGDLYTVTDSDQLSRRQSKFTMDANRNLYTIARIIEGLNLILKMLQSLDRQSRTDN